MKIFRSLLLALAAVLAVAQVVLAANDAPTGFSNQGGIRYTRHNMSQSTLSDTNGGAVLMKNFRNGYGEVCVYCHTPHGANINAKVPLWNRSLPTTTYTTYDQLNTNTLTQTVYQPGAASLPCLSCHDGLQAIDAIINMPRSGGYNPVPDPTLWVASGAGTSKANSHRAMGPGAASCMSCHNPDAGTGQPGDPTDFTVFVIGTDLRNDHPVGVKFPATTGPDTGWNTPGGSKSIGPLTSKFFDENNNQRMDKQEIRLYDSGNGPTVECASCHDPHGVSPTGSGGTINPTFLRKSNAESAVCQTCHAK